MLGRLREFFVGFRSFFSRGQDLSYEQIYVELTRESEEFVRDCIAQQKK